MMDTVFERLDTSYSFLNSQEDFIAGVFLLIN
jgi:hypothetical protein